jgi:exosortase F-associated protein
MNKVLIRSSIGGLSLIGLLIVFLFQKIDVAGYLSIHDKLYNFLVNRSIRFVLNDLFAIALIYALFHQKKYVVFALWVQLAGVIFILIPYFILKIYFLSYNGPLISFLHRLILNPILILLLIPAFYYQKKVAR